MNEVKKEKYARATYGSLAYDFNRVRQPEIEMPEEPAINPKPRTKVKLDTNKRTKTAAKPKVGLAPLSVFGFMAAAFMLIMVLMGYIQLTKISAESSALQKKITELKNNEAKLKVQYESTFDLTKVEEYAVARLGMVQATSSQVYYINNNIPDKAEIIHDKGNAGLFKSVSTFLSHVVEYFK